MTLSNGGFALITSMRWDQFARVCLNMLCVQLIVTRPGEIKIYGYFFVDIRFQFEKKKKKKKRIIVYYGQFATNKFHP